MAEMSTVISTANGQTGFDPDERHAGDLFTRYQPQDELGRGPLAVVYRALDEKSGEPVALKLFDAHFRQEPRFAIRFRHHLQAVLGLDHAHLVAVKDYGLAGDHFYIVTELVDGVNLATLLAERGPLAPGVAAAAARQVCLALAAAHARGLVHRNLKPENVLLTRDGQVKVADVGLSGLLSESGMSRTSVMLYSANYMAPEQARGQPATPPADIYSLGVILFEMLTGHPPFVSGDVWQVVQMHLQADPPSPRQQNPDVTPELAAVVARALRKKPDERFITADEMAEALAPLASAIGNVEALPRSSQTETERRPRRWSTLLQDARRRARRVVAQGVLITGGRRLPRPALLLVLQFFTSFALTFLLLLALTSSPPAATVGGDGQHRSITKPLPATAPPTAPPTPAATWRRELSPRDSLRTLAGPHGASAPVIALLTHRQYPVAPSRNPPGPTRG